VLAPPLKTTKYCELGVSNIGELGVMDTVETPVGKVPPLAMSVDMRANGKTPFPANNSSV
jgi:hypothetical protein